VGVGVRVDEREREIGLVAQLLLHGSLLPLWISTTGRTGRVRYALYIERAGRQVRGLTGERCVVASDEKTMVQVGTCLSAANGPNFVVELADEYCSQKDMMDGTREEKRRLQSTRAQGDQVRPTCSAFFLRYDVLVDNPPTSLLSHLDDIQHYA